MSNLFSFLDDYSTDKKLSINGLVPSITTILTLLAVSAVLTFVPMMWAHASIQASLYMSYFAYTFVSVVGLSLFNFWFERELQFYSLGAGPINPGDGFGEICLDKMVNHLVHELNALDGTQDINHPNHLIMPRLAKFSSTEVKIICIPGRNIDRGAIYFSDGVLNSKVSGLNQSELAAMIMAELHKIKRCRSVTDTTLGIINSLSRMLDGLMESPNPLLKAIGYIAVPLKLFFFIHNSILRSHIYEAATAVVDCGRGDDYLAALNRKGHASRTKKRSESAPKISEAMAQRNPPKRPPYQTPCLDWAKGQFWFPNGLAVAIDDILRPIASWVDENEYLTDAKLRTSRFSSFFDACVRKGAFYLKEVVSDKPSGTHLKDHIKACLNDDTLVKRPFAIDEEHRYKPVDHHKRLRWRYKRAALKGELSYEKLKSLGCKTSHMCHTNEIRKQCKKSIVDFLEKHGLEVIHKKSNNPAKSKNQVSHRELKGVLYPLVFSHNVKDKMVVIHFEASKQALTGLLREHHKRPRKADIESLYATEPELAPQFR